MNLFIERYFYRIKRTAELYHSYAARFVLNYPDNSHISSVYSLGCCVGCWNVQVIHIVPQNIEGFPHNQYDTILIYIVINNVINLNLKQT